MATGEDKAGAQAEGDTPPQNQGLQIVLTAEQIQRRVRELARQISDAYRGKTLHVVCVLENGFIFMADLVRELDLDVVCQFMKPEFRSQEATDVMEIFFSPEVEVRGRHVLLLEGLVQSGVTTEFLLRNLAGRGAASVKLITLLDRQADRRVSLQPDYFGFLIQEDFVMGYGLGSPQLGRNLPHIVIANPQGAMTTGA
jgi:hypoxanthine phosphoribosyltransferase